MHPQPVFAWTDREEMLAFLSDIGFSSIFVAGEGRPFLVHAPVLAIGSDRLHFHVARANRATPVLDGTMALVSCVGAHAYVSPDWYGAPDQVPTWNYVAVECTGRLQRLDRDALPGLLDALSARYEEKLFPKPAWTRAKMSEGRFEAMLGAIEGYELRIEEMSGTRKLGQNKPAAQRLAASAGLDLAGEGSMAALMRETIQA